MPCRSIGSQRNVEGVTGIADSLRINTVGEFGPRTAAIVKERYMIEYDLDKEHSILHVQPSLRSSKTTL